LARLEPAGPEAAQLPLPSSARQTSPLLIPDILHNIAEQLSPIERGLLLRELCKEARGLLPAVVVHLSAAVPEQAFAAKWGQPDSCKGLALAQRHDLLRLTAKSGVVANLRRVAPSAAGEAGAAGCGLPDTLFEAAAGAGQLPMCQLLAELGAQLDLAAVSAAARNGHADVLDWLLASGCEAGEYLLEAAAEGGQAQLFESLLAKGVPWSDRAAGCAARGGHERLMRRILELSARGSRRGYGYNLTEGAAAGLGLKALQVGSQGHAAPKHLPRCRPVPACAGPSHWPLISGAAPPAEDVPPQPRDGRRRGLVRRHARGVDQPRASGRLQRRRLPE
jgi:hypothetical protein